MAVVLAPSYAAQSVAAVITCGADAYVKTDIHPPQQTTMSSTANKNLYFPLPPAFLY